MKTTVCLVCGISLKDFINPYRKYCSEHHLERTKSFVQRSIPFCKACAVRLLSSARYCGECATAVPFLGPDEKLVAQAVYDTGGILE